MSSIWKIKNFLLLIFFATALVALLLPGVVLPSSNRSIYSLWESGHLVLFFLGCHLLYIFIPRLLNLTFARQSGIILGVTSFCALFVEGLQSFLSGKHLEFTDIIGDITGALVFLSFRSRRNGTKSFSLYGITFFLIGVVLWPVFCSFVDEMLARYQFPLLADFETPFEASRFEGKTGSVSLSKEQAFHGKRSLKLSFFPGPWSGVTLEYLPSDWQGYTQLHFAVYNPGQQPVSLEVLIQDTLHEQRRMPYNDLYSRIISLSAGWTIVRIPLAEVQKAPQTRQMDLTQISGLGFFVEREENPVTLYLDSIRLE